MPPAPLSRIISLPALPGAARPQLRAANHQFWMPRALAARSPTVGQLLLQVAFWRLDRNNCCFTAVGAGLWTTLLPRVKSDYGGEIGAAGSPTAFSRLALILWPTKMAAKSIGCFYSKSVPSVSACNAAKAAQAGCWSLASLASSASLAALYPLLFLPVLAFLRFYFLSLQFFASLPMLP